MRQETKISEVIEVQETPIVEPEEELVIEPVSMTVPEVEDLSVEEVVEEEVQELTKTIFKVYHLGNFVKDVEEDSDSLNSFLASSSRKNEVTATTGIIFLFSSVK